MASPTVRTKSATDTTPNLSAQVGRFVLYQGRLAHVMGAAFEADKPARWINLRVMDRGVEDWELVLVGAKAEHLAYVGNGRTINVPNLWNWPVVQITEPVPQPRDTKRHTWRWGGTVHLAYERRAVNGWVPVEFPSCNYCRTFQRTVNGRRVTYSNVHPPTWQYAEQCDVCHPDGICPGTGVCKREVDANA